MFRACLIALILAGCSVSAFAQSYTFDNGGGDGTFSNMLNWNPDGLPGAGDSIAITGTVALTGTATVDNVSVNGGHLNVNGGGTLNVTVSATLMAGIFGGNGGTVNLQPGSTFTVSGNSSKNIGDGCTINLFGNGTWTGTGTFSFGSTSPNFNIRSGAIFNIQNDATWFSGILTIDAGGTLRKSVATGTTDVDGSAGFSVLNNNGTVDIQSGTVILPGGLSTGVFNVASGAVASFNRGTQTIQTGATFTGAGLLQVNGSTVSFNTAVNIPNFGVVSGVTNGSGSVTVTSSAALTGGTFGPTVTIGGGVTLAISGNNTKNLFDNGTLNIAGTATWTGTGRISFGSQLPNVNILNGGLFDIQNDAILECGNLTVSAGGTLRKTVATGTTNVATNFTNLTNNGTVDVQTGVVQFAGTGISTGAFTTSAPGTISLLGGTQTLQTGATITGAGTFLVSGTSLVINTAITAPSFAISGGATSGSGSLTVTGALTQTGGVLGPVVNIPAGATLVLSGNSQKNLQNGATINLAGTATWTGTGNISFSAVSPNVNIQNGGIFDIQNDQSLQCGNLTIATGGILRKTAGLGTSDLASFTTTINNGGTIEATTGTLSFGGNFTQNAGLTRLNGGALSGTIRIMGGKLMGGGTITGSVTNSGTVEIGANEKLTLTGNYTQSATGTLAIAVGGTTAGAGFGQLSLGTGTTATLAGTLALSLSPGFTPGTSDTFQAVIAATVTGTFTTITGSTGLNALYAATSVTLFNAGPPPVIDFFVAPTPARAGKALTFSIQATDPDSTALTATINFGDGTAMGTINLTSGQSATTTHTYAATAPAAVNGSVTVTDSFTIVTMPFTIALLLPAPGAENIQNISQAAAPVVNPLGGLGLQMTDSAGGVIELTLSAKSGPLAASTCQTSFDGGTAVVGLTPVAKFTQPKIAVASSTAMQSGASVRARKTLVIGAQEVALGTGSIVDNRTSKAVEIKTLKGKFTFKDNGSVGAKADSVSLSGLIKLPAGVDLSQSRKLSVAIGNVIDEVMVDAKGKGSAGTSGRVTKLKVKYPKIKGATVTVGNETAQVDFTISLPDLDLAGFDTEGVAKGASDLDSKRMAKRSVQVGLLLEGMAYEFAAPVNFKSSKNDDTAQIIGGRGAK